MILQWGTGNHYAKIKMATARERMLFVLMMLDEDSPPHLERKTWARQWLLRKEKGAFHTIFQELAIEDAAGFTEYMPTITLPTRDHHEPIRRGGGHTDCIS